jgi:hypothetical protein
LNFVFKQLNPLAELPDLARREALKGARRMKPPTIAASKRVNTIPASALGSINLLRKQLNRYLISDDRAVK